MDFLHNPFGAACLNEQMQRKLKNIKILVGNSSAKRDITLVTYSKRALKPINGRHLSGY